MSTSEEKLCASCGLKPAGKLRRCCKDTFYCDVTCQKNHRKIHRPMCQNTNMSKNKKSDCKRKIDELCAVGESKALAVDDDYDLLIGEESGLDMDNYKLPPLDDCPLCAYPMPIDSRKIDYMPCCGKTVCLACSWDYGEKSVERGVSVDTWTKCVFCRGQRTNGGYDKVQQLMKGANERKDANAFYLLAQAYENGRDGLPINYQKAFDMYYQSMKLGSASAAHSLGYSYMHGDIVRVDKKLAIHFLSKAAKGGILGSLHLLGVMKLKEGSMNKNLDFLQYFFTAAELGWKDSIDQIKVLLDYGLVSEEDYKRAHESYLVALKEEQTASRKEVVARIYKERAERNERPIS